MADEKGDSGPEPIHKHQEDPNFLKWMEDDKYLRKVEINTLIPKRMREEAKKICKQYEDEYVECCRNHKVLLFWKCRPENKAFNDCLIKQYENPELREACTEQYLKDRAQFRHTGIPAQKSARSKKIEEFQKQMKNREQQQQQQQTEH